MRVGYGAGSQGERLARKHPPADGSLRVPHVRRPAPDEVEPVVERAEHEQPVVPEVGDDGHLDDDAHGDDGEEEDDAEHAEGDETGACRPDGEHDRTPREHERDDDDERREADDETDDEARGDAESEPNHEVEGDLGPRRADERHDATPRREHSPALRDHRRDDEVGREPEHEQAGEPGDDDHDDEQRDEEDARDRDRQHADEDEHGKRREGDEHADDPEPEDEQTDAGPEVLPERPAEFYPAGPQTGHEHELHDRTHEGVAHDDDGEHGDDGNHDRTDALGGDVRDRREIDVPEAGSRWCRRRRRALCGLSRAAATADAADEEGHDGEPEPRAPRDGKEKRLRRGPGFVERVDRVPRHLSSATPPRYKSRLKRRGGDSYLPPRPQPSRVTATPHERRTRACQERLRALDAAAVIPSPGANLQYLTGVDETLSERLFLCVVPADGDPVFLVPELAGTQVDETTWVDDVRVWRDGDEPRAALDRVLADCDLGAGRVLLDETMPARFVLDVQRLLGDRERVHEFGLATEALGPLRARKDEAELDALRRASAVADRVMRSLRDDAADLVGRSEATLAREVEHRLADAGGDGVSFEPIVAAGPNGAKPHHAHGDRVVGAGEPVVFDFGTRVDGYPSDTTRTVVLAGDPPAEFETVHGVVREAATVAIDAVEPGVEARAVDRAARDVIEAAGYGEAFVHRTGHGVGLEVHEEPYIASDSETRLEPGMVFSVEPGVYLDGAFGVRIEDLVVVTEAGCERLNDSPRGWAVDG